MVVDDEIPFYQENRVSDDTFINKLNRVATSALLFIVSYILSNLLLQALIAWISKMFNYTVKFTYNQVSVYPWDYHRYSRTKIVIMFFFPPVICFLIGSFIYNLLRINSGWLSIIRLFFFWLSVCLVNMVLTHALVSPLGSPNDRTNGLYQTFAVVSAWLWINPAIMFMVAIGALVVSLCVGMVIRQEIMRYSISNNMLQIKKGMDAIVIQVYILPVLFGILPVFCLCRPVNFFTTIMQFANLGIISIGIFLMNSIGISRVRSAKEDILNHVPYVEVAVCTLVWLGVFVFLK